jgi:ABC-type glycerol-3-phosphate transport system substrate-binding protein
MVALTGNRFERLAVAADTFVGYTRFQPADWHFLSDLSPFVNDPSFPADDFYPGALDHFRWQGGIYGLPAEIRPFLIFYDRELFDRAGVSHPYVGWTWDDLAQAAAQLTEREDQAVQRYGFVDDWPEMTVTAMMHQHGASLWDDRTHPPPALL